MTSLDLPSFIPLFPLPNVVLFPEVPLPLHVFEPRYRQMVRDALAGSGLIGMVLLRGDWEREYYGAPEVYRVGCAGKIVDSTPLPDGKYNILLAGVREFEIVSEQRERAYRQASVVWRTPRANDELPADLRVELVGMIRSYLGATGDEQETLALLRERDIADDTLVNFFAFSLDLAPLEKQCLLEATGEARARRLRDVLDFRRYAAGHVNVGAPPSRMH